MVPSRDIESMALRKSMNGVGDIYSSTDVVGNLSLKSYNKIK